QGDAAIAIGVPGVSGVVGAVGDLLAEQVAAALHDEGELLRQDRPLLPPLLRAEVAQIEGASGGVEVAVDEVGDELTQGGARVGESLAHGGRDGALFAALRGGRAQGGDAREGGGVEAPALVAAAA